MRQTSVPPAWLEPEILASERQQMHALNRWATGMGLFVICWIVLCTSLDVTTNFTKGLTVEDRAFLDESLNVHLLWTRRLITPFFYTFYSSTVCMSQTSLLFKFFYKSAEVYLHLSLGASVREMKCQYKFVVEDSEGRTLGSLGHQSEDNIKLDLK